MNVVLLLLLGVLAVVIASALWLFVFRHRSDVSSAPAEARTSEEDREQEARREATSQRGTELLERRVSLDARRGALGGNEDLLSSLDDLERRYTEGQLSEAAYEQEKTRLLEG
jgi:hypothetical protein